MLLQDNVSIDQTTSFLFHAAHANADAPGQHLGSAQDSGYLAQAQQLC